MSVCRKPEMFPDLQSAEEKQCALTQVLSHESTLACPTSMLFHKAAISENTHTRLPGGKIGQASVMVISVL